MKQNPLTTQDRSKLANLCNSLPALASTGDRHFFVAKTYAGQDYGSYLLGHLTLNVVTYFFALSAIELTFKCEEGQGLIRFLDELPELAWIAADKTVIYGRQIAKVLDVPYSDAQQLKQDVKKFTDSLCKKIRAA